MLEGNHLLRDAREAENRCEIEFVGIKINKPLVNLSVCFIRVVNTVRIAPSSAISLLNHKKVKGHNNRNSNKGRSEAYA